TKDPGSSGDGRRACFGPGVPGNGRPRDTGPAAAAAASHLDDDRNDHRAAPVVVAHPPADRAADQLAELVQVVHAVAGGVPQHVLDPGDDLVEVLVEDARAARVDLGPCDELAGRRVDPDDDGDEALLAEDAPVLQGRLGDLADRQAVHVHVSGGHGAHDLGPAVDEVDDDAVLGDDDVL